MKEARAYLEGEGKLHLDNERPIPVHYALDVDKDLLDGAGEPPAEGTEWVLGHLQGVAVDPAMNQKNPVLQLTNGARLRIRITNDKGQIVGAGEFF
jgi:hypothetical protein